MEVGMTFKELLELYVTAESERAKYKKWYRQEQDDKFEYMRELERVKKTLTARNTELDAEKQGVMTKESKHFSNYALEEDVDVPF
jgi:acyl-CoA synthetase (NDP forming)